MFSFIDMHSHHSFIKAHALTIENVVAEIQMLINTENSSKTCRDVITELLSNIAATTADIKDAVDGFGTAKGINRLNKWRMEFGLRY